MACATHEVTGPPAAGPESAPDAGSPPAAGASGIGGPCSVSMVRNVDGKPSARQLCETGLICDYASSVPDGAGRCKRP